MKIKKNLFLKLLTVLCLFILVSCGSSLERPKSNTDYKNIIGNPIKIANIEVAQYDFPEKMKWDEAKAAVTKLGDGWGLPTKDELNVLYQNKDKIGGFASDVYWSSTEWSITTEDDLNFAWFQKFGNGFQGNGDKDVANKNYTSYVRAIRAF